MQIEYEAKFGDIDKDSVRKALKKAGAKCVKKECQQKRVVFNLPKEKHRAGSFARVRDEGDRITTSIKYIDGDQIENQKEICLKIDNFDNAVEFLKNLGCTQKSYQENMREKWLLGDVEITIDTWPFLEPYIEVEGPDEESVKKASALLGFDYSKALFGSLDVMLTRKYNITPERINQQTPVIVFDMENPFL